MARKPFSKQKQSVAPAAAGRPGPHDRPTLNPPFDVEAYARATDAISPRDDAWVDAPSAFFSPETETEPRAERITMTNEAELESARARSAQSTTPPGARSAGALSIADARAPSLPPARNSSPTAGAVEADDASGGPEITERTIEDPVAEMRERFSLGDYTGSLEMAELILAEDPRHLEAAECGENCRIVLEKMYAARLGPLDRIPMVIVPRAQLRWLSIDHRAGFVLSLIDGSSTVEMVLDVSGMARLDALRILHELVQKHIVAFR